MAQVAEEVAWNTLVGMFFSLFGALAVVLAFNLWRQHRHQQRATALLTDADHDPAAPPVKKPATAKQRPIAAEKSHPSKHHQLDLNTLKGHSDAVTGLSFTSNGRGLATACGDGVVRIFKLEDASSKSFKFLRLNTPSGSVPTHVVFGEGSSQLVVACQNISGAGLCMYGTGEGKAAALAREQGKLPLPEIKWDKQRVHDRQNILTLVNATASYGTGDGSVIVASCSEGTDIKLWLAGSGKCVGTVDTNQLKNTMAALSPDGRFLSAAAFTADVKVWELVYGKDGQVREILKVMQLKGHKSAVTWLCFTWDSERIITASKDGSIRIWYINVRYNMQEDPKCLKVFTIPLLDEKNIPVQYELLAVSPDNKMLAVTKGSTLQWLSTETGGVLDTAYGAHDGNITSLAWSPQPVPTDRGRLIVLATASTDKKVKLWYPPMFH